MYNTTHHVLKRIAVANEAMLSEVKKEVDIMVSYCDIYDFFLTGVSRLSEVTKRSSKYRASHRRSLA